MPSLGVEWLDEGQLQPAQRTDQTHHVTALPAELPGWLASEQHLLMQQLQDIIRGNVNYLANNAALMLFSEARAN